MQHPNAKSDNSCLTITIPFYSNMPFLIKAVRSVLNQNTDRWKLIVVDDCSPEEEIEDFLKSLKDDRISYVRNESNLGLGGNWNRCLSLAQTDLVTIFHSDDILCSNYVSSMLSASTTHSKAAAFFCLASIIDEKGEPTSTVADTVKDFLRPKKESPVILEGEKALASLLKGNYIVCPTLCYRKSVIGSERFNTSLKMVLDFEFTTRLLLREKTLIGLQEVLYQYRRHTNNTTIKHSDTMLRSREEFLLWKKLEHTSRERNWKKATRVAKKRTILKLTIIHLILSDLIHFRFVGCIRKTRLAIKIGSTT